jgi:hypothetical protein
MRPWLHHHLGQFSWPLLFAQITFLTLFVLLADHVEQPSFSYI